MILLLNMQKSAGIILILRHMCTRNYKRTHMYEVFHMLAFVCVCALKAHAKCFHCGEQKKKLKINCHNCKSPAKRKSIIVNFNDATCFKMFKNSANHVWWKEHDESLSFPLPSHTHTHIYPTNFLFLKFHKYLRPACRKIILKYLLNPFFFFLVWFSRIKVVNPAAGVFY